MGKVEKLPAEDMARFSARTLRGWSERDVRLKPEQANTAIQTAADYLDQAADALAALQAENERLRLFIASDASRAAGMMCALTGPVVQGDSPEAYLGRMADLFQREGEKLEKAIRAALKGDAP